jgi:hypothetical protein
MGSRMNALWITLLVLTGLWATSLLFAVYLLTPWRLNHLVNDPGHQAQPTHRR